MPQRDRSEVNARLLMREQPGTEALEAARALGGDAAAAELALARPREAFGWLWGHSAHDALRRLDVAQRGALSALGDQMGRVLQAGHESDRRFHLLRLAVLALAAAAVLPVSPEREARPPL